MEMVTAATETRGAAHEDAEDTEDPLSPIGEGSSGTHTPPFCI